MEKPRIEPVEKNIESMENIFSIETKIEEKDGVEVEKNIIRFGGVPVESYASKEEIEEILSEVWPTDEAVKMLQAMATNFTLGRGLIIEGGTGIGKTYCVDRFTELVFGKGKKPIDFYCSGETSTCEFLAKYVPNTEKQEDILKWQYFVQSKEGKEIIKELESKAEKGISTEDLENVLCLLAEKAEITSDIPNWKFQLGALPRAMTLGKDIEKPISEENPSLGTILHMQEIGLAQSEIVNALLQLGGKDGKIAESINLWEDGGREVKAGPNFWIVYSTNPPETYEGRQPIDSALLRRNAYLKMEEKQKNEKEHIWEEYLREVSKGSITFKDLKKEFPDDYNYALAKLKQFEHSDLEINKEQEIPFNIKALVIKLRSNFLPVLEGAISGGAINADRIQKIEFTADHKSIAQEIIKKYYNEENLEEIIDMSHEMVYLNCFSGEDYEKALGFYQGVKKNLNFSQELEERLPKQEDDVSRDVERAQEAIKRTNEVMARYNEFFNK